MGVGRASYPLVLDTLGPSFSGSRFSIVCFLFPGPCVGSCSGFVDFSCVRYLSLSVLLLSFCCIGIRKRLVELYMFFSLSLKRC